MDGHLLIVGASGRAAAFSALRAGLRPWCLDLFGDLDLRARCPVEVVASLTSRRLTALARQGPPGPWLYTGGLENRPRVVRRLARERPLWGNGAGVLAKVRDPFGLHRALREAGVPCPDVLPPDAHPHGGRWLVKPTAGAGGFGIRVAGRGRPAGPGDYLQAFVEGEARSAIYVAEAAGCRLLGVTHQLVGADWLHAPLHRYCGNVGPLRLTDAGHAAWSGLGDVVARFAGLRGLFGVDAVECDGVPWPVEVNPRYTASVEVLEYATGAAALALHRCEFDEPGTSPTHPWPPWEQDEAPSIIGKAIYYAPKPLTFADDGPWRDVLDDPREVAERPRFADIPPAGHPFAAGRPVLTFFTHADTPEECEARLRAQVAEVDQCLLQ
jgi:predicted ATP-grasp superfamily ATP-dependent carboligase